MMIRSLRGAQGGDQRAESRQPPSPSLSPPTATTQQVVEEGGAPLSHSDTSRIWTRVTDPYHTRRVRSRPCLQLRPPCGDCSPPDASITAWCAPSMEQILLPTHRPPVGAHTSGVRGLSVGCCCLVERRGGVCHVRQPQGPSFVNCIQIDETRPSRLLLRPPLGYFTQHSHLRRQQQPLCVTGSGHRRLE